MKVKIGNYPDRLICNIHDRYIERKYGFGQYPENPTRMDNFVERVEDAVQSFYNIFNWAYFDRLEQKVKVHIDPWDTYSADTTLAHIILPVLKGIREEKNGAPMVDQTDVPSELRNNNPSSAEFWGGNETEDPRFFDRWDWIMDEMIWAFEQKTIDWEDQYYGYDEDGEFQMDVEGHKAHAERMENGFRLFGKYYSSLWT